MRAHFDSTSGLIGITSVVALGFRGSRTFLQIQNGAAAGGNNLAFTFVSNDQSPPTLTTNNINGLTTVTLAPGGSATYDSFCPTNAIAVVASGASTPLLILYAVGGTG